MIAIINYGAGNIASVKNALSRFGVNYCLTNNIEELERADGIIFPGQGHFGMAMKSLKQTGLDNWLKETTKPILGICVGMQLMFEGSEESDVAGLGILPGTLKKFDQNAVKVPHMGWNTLVGKQSHPLIDSFNEKHFFYFVHSYYAPVSELTLASCSYEQEFSAVVARDNYLGVQFHPEKSGREGALLIQNFMQMVEHV
jgi:glutamine amidotransferase